MTHGTGMGEAGHNYTFFMPEPPWHKHDEYHERVEHGDEVEYITRCRNCNNMAIRVRKPEDEEEYLNLSGKCNGRGYE